jgi:hypothetical protein
MAVRARIDDQGVRRTIVAAAHEVSIVTQNHVALTCFVRATISREAAELRVTILVKESIGRKRSRTASVPRVMTDKADRAAANARGGKSAGELRCIVDYADLGGVRLA